MTPGAYLKQRRQTAGLAIEDVAHAIETVPAIPENGRAKWLMLIEADATPVLWNTLIAIRQVVPFSLDVLERLSLIAGGAAIRPPRLCPVCAATLDLDETARCFACTSTIGAA